MFFINSCAFVSSSSLLDKAPSFFPLIMTMIKPFLHECDGPKIKVFGSDKKQWTAALLEEIEADQLPAFFGGTMTDPDGNPKCPSKVKNTSIIQ
jgi:hypothetical protein